MAKGVKGLWVRGGTEFVLNDAQYAGRSDAAQALFWWFGAQVLKHHGEFLPLDYSDPKMIARLRGRTAGTMRKAIDELAAPMPRPLVAKMPDGRLRVLGQREKHGDNIGWVDERAEARAWNAANPNDQVNVDAFSEWVPKGRSKPEASSQSVSEVDHGSESPQKNFSQNEGGGQSQEADTNGLTKTTPKQVGARCSAPVTELFTDVEEEQEPDTARTSAPKGQRAPSDAATDKTLQPSAAKSSADDAEAAAPYGRGSDAPTANSMEENGDGAFDRADDPQEAARIWGMIEKELQQWNGHDPGEQKAARALARGLMRTHEEHVDVLMAVWDTVYSTKTTVEDRWQTFGKLLKDRGGGSLDARAWAKTVTG